MPFDMNDPETKAGVKALIDAALANAKTSNDEAHSALQATNAKLLAQLREAKKGTEIDPAKHAALEDKVTELETQLANANKQATKAAKEMSGQVEALTKQLQQESGFTQKLLVDNGLSDALVKAGVGSKFLPAVKAMLAGQVTIAQDGDSRKAMVGDKPLADFITGWASSDDGKHFVSAPINSGGGANGQGNAMPTAKTFIAAGDKAAFGANLAELAKGTASSVQIAPIAQ